MRLMTRAATASLALATLAGAQDYPPPPPAPSLDASTARLAQYRDEVTGLLDGLEAPVAPPTPDWDQASPAELDAFEGRLDDYERELDAFEAAVEALEAAEERVYGELRRRGELVLPHLHPHTPALSRLSLVAVRTTLSARRTGDLHRGLADAGEDLLDTTSAAADLLLRRREERIADPGVRERRYAQRFLRAFERERCGVAAVERTTRGLTGGVRALLERVSPGMFDRRPAAGGEPFRYRGVLLRLPDLELRRLRFDAGRHVEYVVRSLAFAREPAAVEVVADQLVVLRGEALRDPALRDRAMAAAWAGAPLPAGGALRLRVDYRGPYDFTVEAPRPGAAVRAAFADALASVASAAGWDVDPAGRRATLAGRRGRGELQLEERFAAARVSPATGAGDDAGGEARRGLAGLGGLGPGE